MSDDGLMWSRRMEGKQRTWVVSGSQAIDVRTETESTQMQGSWTPCSFGWTGNRQVIIIDLI